MERYSSNNHLVTVNSVALLIIAENCTNINNYQVLFIDIWEKFCTNIFLI